MVGRWPISFLGQFWHNCGQRCLQGVYAPSSAKTSPPNVKTFNPEATAVGGRFIASGSRAIIGLGFVENPGNLRGSPSIDLFGVFWSWKRKTIWSTYLLNSSSSSSSSSAQVLFPTAWLRNYFCTSTTATTSTILSSIPPNKIHPFPREPPTPL